MTKNSTTYTSQISTNKRGRARCTHPPFDVSGPEVYFVDLLSLLLFRCLAYSSAFSHSAPAEFGLSISQPWRMALHHIRKYTKSKQKLGKSTHASVCLSGYQSLFSVYGSHKESAVKRSIHHGLHH